MNTMYFDHTKQEFTSHALFADQFLTSRETISPHILAHPFLLLCEAGLMVLFNVPSTVAGFFILTLAYVSLGLVIYAEVLKRLKVLGKWTELISVGITTALMIVAQIPVLLPVDRHIYFGYIGINAYNNSTLNLLKPFALVSFLYTLKIFSETRPGWKDILISAVFMIIGTLAKPNYVICVLPALGLYVLYRLYRREGLQWRFMIWGIIVPACATLTWQYAINYGAGSGGIYFAPLLVKYYYSDMLIVKFFASILFPLLATRLYIRMASRDPKMILAWLCFIIGAFYSYFMSETSGGNYTMGNFDWSAEVSLFILFVVVTLFWVERLLEKKRWEKKDTAAALAFALHLVSGGIYYLYSLSVDDYSRLDSLRRLLDVFGKK